MHTNILLLTSWPPPLRRFECLVFIDSDSGGAVAGIASLRGFGGRVVVFFVGDAVAGAVVCSSNGFVDAGMADGDDAFEGWIFFKGF